MTLKGEISLPPTTGAAAAEDVSGRIPPGMSAAPLAVTPVRPAAVVPLLLVLAEGT
jgi:hypothetical protein